MESLKIEEICTGIIILVSKIVPNFLQINENQKKNSLLFSFYQFIAHFCVCRIVSFRNGIFKGIKNEKKSIQKVKKLLKHITQKTFSSHSTDNNT